MIPQIKKRNIATVLMAKRSPEGSIDMAPEMDAKSDEGLKVALKDLMNAFEAGDIDAAASAFKAASELCDYDEPLNEPAGE